jgi:uncharacterized protein YbbK (DUF523 family)
MPGPIQIGVSACLLGEKVRYDGGHKRAPYITDTLGKLFTFVAVCPEVESGMPTPREPMRLEGDPATPRLVTKESRIDRTEQMLSYCREKVEELGKADLCGFIFKKNSPSSGLFEVTIHDTQGNWTGSGSGLFANAVARRFPLLPMVEDEQLYDTEFREVFIERVFGYHRGKGLRTEAAEHVKF